MPLSFPSCTDFPTFLLGHPHCKISNIITLKVIVGNYINLGGSLVIKGQQLVVQGHHVPVQSAGRYNH